MPHVSRQTCLVIVLVALVGLSGGRLASEALLRLAPPPTSPAPVAAAAAQPAVRSPLGDTGRAFALTPTSISAASAPALSGEAHLLGTFFSSAPSALVRLGETTLLVHPGAALGALGKVRQVERGALLVETASGVRRLALAGEVPAATPAASPAAAPAAPMALSPKAVAAARADLPSLLQSARLAPRTTASGAIDGFVVKMVKPGSLLSSMGVRNGDVLLEAGRIRLDSLDQAMAALRQAQAARSLRLTVERGGSPLVFTYTLPE